MYPNINDCPDLPYELIEKDNLLYDLIGNVPVNVYDTFRKQRITSNHMATKS